MELRGQPVRMGLVFSFHADPKAQTQASPFLYPLGHFVDFSSNPFPPFVLSARDGTQGVSCISFLGHVL